MICKHQWNVVIDKTIPSNFERLVSLGVQQFKYCGDDIKATHVIVLTCSKCGKIHTEKTRT